MFVPIVRRDQVPRVGAGFETGELDLKGHPDAYKRTASTDEGARGSSSRAKRRDWDEFELAKDVAAFANRSGGTILVGAAQDRATGTCAEHKPFDPSLVPPFETTLRAAVSNRCRPGPVFQLDPIPFDDKKVMVAVNVWAFPGQAIGVRVKGDPGDCGEWAYVFPIRVLSHTDYLPAEQLPMLMSPDQRRTAVLLSSLKEGATIDVHPKLVVEADQNLHSLKVTFVCLRELRNALVVKVAGTGGAPVEVGIPLDEISVWFEGPDGDQCHIRCDRRLVVRR